MKKFISIALTLILLVTTCFVAGILPASAESTEQHWLEFEAKQMKNYLGDSTDWDAWSIDETTPYRCATWINWGYAHSDFANIRKLVVSESGTLSIENKWGATGITNLTADQSFEFAILDKNKKIVYPENGDVATVVKDAPIEVNFTTTVEAGDEFYFVFMNPTTDPLAYYTSSIITLNSTRLDNGGGYYATDITTQGASGWYFMYAEDVTKTTLDPNGYTDNGGDIYTAEYTATQMTNIRVANGDVNNGWLGDPDKTVGTTTFAQGSNIYLKTGETAIIRYTASEDGYFSIGYCGVKLKNSSGYDNWTEEKGVDFSIVDSNGTLLYPEYGGPAQLRGTDAPEDKATVPSRLYHYNMKAGEHIDFVFKPTATLPVSTTGYVQMNGSFSFNGKRVDSGGQLGLGYTSAQGTRGITMLYSTDAVIEKTVTDEWSEYVQLSKAFTAAPATIEAYVNIPAEVKDYKTGVILSDMGGEDDTNGTQVSVDYFGHPRLILRGGEVDVTFDAVDLRTGAWEHVAFTYDGTTGEAKLYLNGDLADSRTASAVTLAASDRAAVIGNDMSYTKSAAFQGAMKKLVVYSDVRTEAEIEADMAAVSSSADGLIGYWVLNGAYTDRSSNANTGVLTNVGSAWYKDTAPAAAEDGEFTIVHIGDMQVTTDFLYGVYPKMTEWIASKKSDLNIQMVVNTGDLVNNEDQSTQWTDAKNGMAVLTAANIPVVYSPGNHEYPSSGTGSRDASTFNTHFPIADYFTQAGAEGEESTQIIYAYPNTEKLTTVDALTDETLENAVYLKYINGVPYIFFAFEVQPRNEVVAWANTVMPLIEAEYTDAVTIVADHHYLTVNGKIDDTNECFTETHRTECNTPEQFYTNFVSKYKSISLVLCGHVASDVATRTDIGTNDNKITTIMNDPSYEGDGGNGVMMLLRFKADGTVKAEYYSPLLDAYYRTNSQFEFDSTEVEKKLSLPTMTELGWARTGNSGDPTWFRSSSFQGGHYIQYRAMHTYNNNAVSRSYKADIAGTMSYKINITSASTGVRTTLCRADGTVLWPTTDLWYTSTASGASGALSTTVTFDVEKDEMIHLIVKNIDTATAKTHYIEASGTITSYDEAETVEFKSSEIGSTQGENNWYTYELSTSKITEVPVSHTVSYSATEGGSVSASTGGTAEDGKLIIEQGGTAYFTTTPAEGYRFAGYFADGKLYSTGRKLVMANVDTDMTVEARFERIKIEGDSNIDGSVDILDLVLMANESDLVRKEMVDLVDDNIIDGNDTAALRQRLLD